MPQMRTISRREFSDTVIIAADVFAERDSRNRSSKAVRLGKHGITIGVRSWMVVTVGSKPLMGSEAPFGLSMMSAPSRKAAAVAPPYRHSRLNRMRTDLRG